MCDLYKKILCREKVKKNMGFTLVEVVVAIALLVIVVTPIMNSFITSARVNRNARKVMVATDVGQDLIEGFSEKTFQSLEAAIKIAPTSDLTGTAAFTTFNDGAFNLSKNWVPITDANVTNAIHDVTKSSLGYYTYTYNTQKLISDNTITQSMNRIVEKAVLADTTKSVSDSHVYYIDIPSADVVEEGFASVGLVYMVYTNIEGYNGYKFNAVISIIPTADVGAHGAKDYFYSYNIKVTMYDAEDVAGDNFGNPVITLLGGLASQ